MDQYSGYLGLLRWSLSHKGDGTKPSDAVEMSEEKRKFLDEVMKAVSIDEAKLMKEWVDTLTPEGEEDDAGISADEIAKREDTLDALMDTVDRIDSAKDLHKIGGLIPLIGVLRSKHESLRAKAAETLSVVVQNYQKAQIWALQNGALGELMKLMVPDESDAVRYKVLLAISSLVRDTTMGLRAFFSRGGMALLASLLRTKNTRLRRRTVFFLRHCFVGAWATRCKMLGLDKGIVPLLEACIGSEDLDTRINALVALAEFHTFVRPEDLKEAKVESGIKITRRKHVAGSVADSESGGGGGGGGGGGDGKAEDKTEEESELDKELNRDLEDTEERVRARREALKSRTLAQAVLSRIAATRDMPKEDLEMYHDEIAAARALFECLRTKK